MNVRSLVFILSIIVAYLVYKDATQRGFANFNALMWAIGVVIFPPVAIILYLIARYINKPTYNPPQKKFKDTKLCPKCGHENPPSIQKCSICGNSLEI